MVRLRKTMRLFFALLTVSAALEAADDHPLHPESIKLPPGFHISIYADHVKNARSMVLSPSGILFVGTRSAGNVYAILDKSHRHQADEVITIASGLENPNGVAFKDGALYVAERSRVLRFDAIEDHLRNPPKPVVIYAGYPDKAHHGWKFMAFGPDGWLYIPVGAPCNICKQDDPVYATITRLSPDGQKREIFASGIRNTVGFAWHPQTGELWFTDNGRDEMGDDTPPDELNVAPRPGMNFGFPYCHAGDIPDPEFGKEKSCKEFTPPVQKLGPHVAALGMRFYTGTMFPERYRNDIFIAEHGSWNRTVPLGYRVMHVHLKNNKPVSYEIFAQGWLPIEPQAEDPHKPNTLRADESADIVKIVGGAKPTQAWGRPVDVLVMPDGALLVSDDTGNAIYRITYQNNS